MMFVPQCFKERALLQVVSTLGAALQLFIVLLSLATIFTVYHPYTHGSSCVDWCWVCMQCVFVLAIV